MMLSSKAVGVACVEGSSRAQRASGSSIPSRLWEMPTLSSLAVPENPVSMISQGKKSLVWIPWGVGVGVLALLS